MTHIQRPMLMCVRQAKSVPWFMDGVVGLELEAEEIMLE